MVIRLSTIGLLFLIGCSVGPTEESFQSSEFQVRGPENTCELTANLSDASDSSLGHIDRDQELAALRAVGFDPGESPFNGKNFELYIDEPPTEQALQQLRRARFVESIIIRDLEAHVDRLLKHIVELKGLRSLHVLNSRMDSGAVAMLPNCTELVELGFENNNLDDCSTLGTVLSLPKITDLYSSGNTFRTGTFSNEANTSLKRVTIVGSELSSRNFATLVAKIPEARGVSIASTRLTREDAVHLSSLHAESSAHVVGPGFRADKIQGSSEIVSHH